MYFEELLKRSKWKTKISLDLLTSQKRRIYEYEQYMRMRKRQAQTQVDASNYDSVNY